VGTTFSVGYQLGGYVIKSLVGRGGMGVVYAAEHTTLQRRVALKVIAPEVARDEAFRERFLREARLAASLRHPNIIEIYDAGQVGGELYIAMRYVEGASLATVLRLAGRLEPERALSILAKVASALDEAHANGLVHRDVKPDNVLLGSPATRRTSEEVLLTDFGLVRPIDARTEVTRIGSILGTLGYMAPEVLEGGDVDGRSDQYSLACVLYECLTGHVPFSRETDAALLLAHLTAPPPSITDERPELPARFDAVVTRGMAKAREDRYGSCVDLIDDALAALTGSQAATAGPPAELATAIVTGPAIDSEPQALGGAVPGPPTAGSPSPGPPLEPGGTSTASAVRRRRGRVAGVAIVAIAAVAVFVVATLALSTRWGVVAPTASGVGHSAPATTPEGSVPSESPRPSASGSPPAVLGGETWHGTGSLNQARWGHGAARLANGQVLVVGGNAGKDSSSALASAELYDAASGSWTTTASMSRARSYASVTVLDGGKVLVAGGALDNAPLALAELYDPVLGSWSAIAKMSVPRVHHTATLLADGRVLVVGGGISRKTRASTTSAEIYDPGTGRWTRTGSMAVGRSYHTATLLNDGRVLVVGGSSTYVGAGTVRASAEIFDPRTGRWTAAHRMLIHRYVHDAVLLKDGRVLVAGGWASTTLASRSLADSEVFDPLTGAWTTVGSMTAGRAQFRMAALPDGRVVAVGGLGTGHRPLASVDLFDPVSSSWSRTDAMSRACWWPALVVLQDGRALVAGGASDKTGAVPLASSELYGPP
jgi:tRNA A-37 threonylcarbamoyl transferase component Bud32